MPGSRPSIAAPHRELASAASARGRPTLLFTENETNTERSSASPTDALRQGRINDYIVHGRQER
jgi:hypothetical protein